MEEGVLVSWQVKVGDTVAPGDILAEVETDKATMDLDNYEKGTVLHLHVEEGSTVPVDGIIAVIGKEGESYEDQLKEAESKSDSKSEPKKDSAEDQKEEESGQDSKPEPQALSSSTPEPATTSEGGRIKASPLAKKLAEEKGYDLASISGTGEGGRIVKRDVENHTPTAAGASPAVAGQESHEDIPVSQMRKTIAKRLAESKYSAPHFYLTMEVNMDRAVEARKRMNAAEDVKISMNDLIVKATAMALKSHPKINSSWLGDKIRINHHIHIGVAVAVDEGLLVPVVRFADQKTLSTIGNEVKSLAKKAKNKELQPEDWSGNTFTISNLGMFGIEEFTAIINPPDACIMAIGATKETVIVENGEMRPAHMMKVTLSCDHRVVDGVTGSLFLQTFKELMEDPIKMLV